MTTIKDINVILPESLSGSKNNVSGPESAPSIFQKIGENKQMHHGDLTAYRNIYELRQSFIRSGGHSDNIADRFNYLETPAQLYFQIFFHFNTGHGLLNIDNKRYINKNTEITEGKMENKNTAINYLWVNREFQRKQMLEDFVTLLSNINVWSPWYFQSIGGLQEALNRTEYTGKFNIEEEPKYITIKCLEDAYDNRISTLLDLYKSICYSKTLHKEILPANLRRFDMSIYIVNTPIQGAHYVDGQSPTFEQPSFQEWQNGSNRIFASSKLLEFQGCEIDANSSYSAYAEVKNDEAFQMQHEIKITFRNVVEQRYNEFLDRIIGDYVFSDQDWDVRESASNPWENDMNSAQQEAEAIVDNKEESNGSQIIKQPFSSWDPTGAMFLLKNQDKFKSMLEGASKNIKPGTMQNVGEQVMSTLMSGVSAGLSGVASGVKKTVDRVTSKLNSTQKGLVDTFGKYIMGNLYWDYKSFGGKSVLEKGTTLLKKTTEDYTKKLLNKTLAPVEEKFDSAVSDAYNYLGGKAKAPNKTLGKLWGNLNEIGGLGWIRGKKS